MQIGFRLDQFPQVNRCAFDIGIFKLAGPILSGQKSATMDITKVATGKFVSCLGIFSVPVVDSQMPFRVFIKAVGPDELILFFGRRAVLGPRTGVIRHKMPMRDQLCCVLHHAFVQFDGIARVSLIPNVRGRSAENRKAGGKKGRPQV